MNESLRELDLVCREIEKEWRKHDDSVEAFPEIVMEKTGNLNLSAFGDLANIMDLMKAPSLAKLQKLTTFSDVYLMLWHNGRFHVEVLNWWGSDINIHDHNFSGVQFQLAGRSLNVLYNFDQSDRSSRLRQGSISVHSAEIWDVGHRSWVRPGGADPHTVHHLSLPTVSLLFRTIPTPDFGPQLNYFPPSLTGSYMVADEIFRKKVSALRMLSRGARIDFHRVFREVVSSQTATENLFTVIKLGDVLFDREHADLLHELAYAGEIERSIVEVAAFRRGAEFMVDTVKPLPGLSPDEILAVSILGATFDEAGFGTILRTLTEAGHEINFLAAFHRLYERLSDAHSREFDKVLDLFELLELRAELTPAERMSS